MVRVYTPLVREEEHQGKSFYRCFACARRCAIAQGMRGVCSIRKYTEKGFELEAYGRPGAVAVDPIEKKPLYHFLPGTRVLSLGTYGCNFFCKFCQNWQLSQAYRLNLPRETYDLPPKRVVQLLAETGSHGLAYTYNEPVTWIEYAHDISLLARREDDRVYSVFVSSGYETWQAWVYMHALLDAVNLDLKGFTEDFYRELVTARLKPVLESIRHAFRLGFWLEITTLIIPGWNDDDEQVRGMARFIRSLSPFIPWHLTAFHPDYQMLDTPPTPLEMLKRAHRIAKEEGLHYVYIGNVRAEENHTYCHSCQAKLVHREGFLTFVTDTFDLDRGVCKACGARIPGVWNPRILRALREEKAGKLKRFVKDLSEDERVEAEGIIRASELFAAPHAVDELPREEEGEEKGGRG